VKRGAQLTPGSARPRSPPPLSREEGERPHDVAGRETRQKTPDPSSREAETPRPQEPKETVLALGAIPPSREADLGCQGRLGQTEECRVEPVLSAVLPEGHRGKGLARPEPPQEKEGVTRRGARVPWFGLTSTIQRGGPDLF